VHCSFWQWIYLGLRIDKILTMKTEHYNPSQLEVEFSYALAELQKELGKFLTHNTISKVENKVHEDNPVLLFHLVDKDGDPHEVVIQVIQRVDKF